HREGRFHETSGHDQDDSDLHRELEQHQERFLDLVKRERINSEAIEEVYDAAVAIANHLYPGHFTQTPSDIPHSDSESSEEVPLASLFPRRRSARIAVLSAPPSQTASPPPISPIDEHPVLPPSTPETISETNPMTDVKALPSRRDKAAPVFDPENPRSLLRYLEDLEDLFKAHPTLITNEADKKRAAVKYVPMHKEEMWKGLPEYEDAAKTYEEFVTALKTLYPAVREDQRYSVGDMDRLVGERVCVGIHNLADLSTFYREFLLITRFLCRRDLISEREQNRAFQRAFNQDLWTKVYTRLQIKNPKQAADTPYGVASVFEAASFFLAGTPATTITEAKAETPERKVKIEEYTSLVDIITKAVSQSLAPTLAAMAQGSTVAVNSTPARAMPTAPYQCHYCGANDHSIRRCPKVDEDQRAGRVMRNIEGKVVLPSGIMVPQNLLGANMRERIMEWHRRNPNQVAANIIEQMIYEDIKTVGAPRDIFQLDVNERIKSLEKELFALRKRPTFDGTKERRPHYLSTRLPLHT
ncbi:hypothetical protein NEOLEDRAFT_1178459, partial [Neolentinus lepideus HHB14362 ss-1]